LRVRLDAGAAFPNGVDEGWNTETVLRQTSGANAHLEGRGRD
jgi:hypothetical protein